MKKHKKKMSAKIIVARGLLIFLGGFIVLMIIAML